MRLSKIKLAGFKSFVDPTAIEYPHNLSGIIGPNGCGKSNVIDAVRWVMGETSAKQLRGDSMDDVIFNGSSSRPGVSKASVELIFDNSERALGGQYANYSEIHIRREVSREGQSGYFLNGTRCRRRDIADIFLGTGLGPRSYAIIEQGMISRIIEAKPEELRVYLEEAAGISKYKERRRETENRIRHTRENLDRLNDLREEIDKQLDRLKRQANAAERYKVLKAEERQLKAELLAVRWQALDSKIKEKQKTLEAQQTQIEAKVAEQRALEAGIEKKRQAQIAANDQLNKVQADYYKHGSEISKIEQNIHHHKETTERQRQDLQQIDHAWQSAQQHIEDDKTKLDNLRRDMQDKAPNFDALKQTEVQSGKRLAEAEADMQTWQGRWEACNGEYAQAAQVIEVEEARIKQLQEKVLRNRARQQRLKEERDTISTESLETHLEASLHAEAKAEQRTQELEAQLQSCNEEIRQTRAYLEMQQSELNNAHSENADVRGKLASLQALQQAALGKQDEQIINWLTSSGFAQHPRLAEQLMVDSGWEQAVETVLGRHLEAVCVEGMDAVTAVLGELAQGAVMFLAADDEAPTVGESNRLAAKVRFKGKPMAHVQGLLQHVYVADSLTEALTLRTRMQADESIVTREGLWLGKHWLRVNYAADDSSGVLAREHAIQEGEKQLQSLQHRIQNFETQLQQAKQALTEQEKNRDSLQKQLQQAVSEHAECKGQYAALKNQLEQHRHRREQLNNELRELDTHIGQDEREWQLAKEKSSVAAHSKASLEQQRQELSEQKARLSQVLSEARQRAEADKEALHRIMLSMESMRTAEASTDENLARMQQQIEHLQRRRQELQHALSASDQPIAEMEVQLKGLLEKRVRIEEALSAARVAAETIESQIREREGLRSQLEQQAQAIRSRLDEERLAAQEIRVRSQTIKEQLQESGHQIEPLLENLTEEAAESAWAQRLEQLSERINRMGPINLAAIAEHKEQSERKEYLDAQYKDLTDALTTLEDAINKIDRETRSRFKDVFEQVNSRMKEMFPRLFGGGQAHLEMTGDDLLSTGIAIMARPPGKRISNIHLLSGGEKALTAVAMVFAIFELNPAPFCMLDEVDAPLDEANVGRFCELVKEMSKRVQFIIITHNKTTMEMAEQLMGVTMREAGVSRIVAVDVDEAVKLATA